MEGGRELPDLRKGFPGCMCTCLQGGWDWGRKGWWFYNGVRYPRRQRKKRIKGTVGRVSLGSVKRHLLHAGEEMWMDTVGVEGRTGKALVSSLQFQWRDDWITCGEEKACNRGKDFGCEGVRGIKYKSTRSRGRPSKVEERDFVVEPSDQVSKMPPTVSVGDSQRDSLGLQKKYLAQFYYRFPILNLWERF